MLVIVLLERNPIIGERDTYAYFNAYSESSINAKILNSRDKVLKAISVCWRYAYMDQT